MLKQDVYFIFSASIYDACLSEIDSTTIMKNISINIGTNLNVDVHNLRRNLIFVK